MIHKYMGILLVFILSSYLNNISYANVTGQDGQDTIVVVGKDEKTKIAFGTQPDWMVTGSTSSVKGTELRKSFTSNIANTLYGRLPGLTVMQGNNEPGVDSPILNIRGLGTFGEGKDIIFVVDGFLSSQAYFEQLTPYEIESIELLKDASATAMFGNRAANGVLVVNTIRGKNGPLKIEFSAQYGIQNASRLPEFLGSYDYARLYNEGLANDGKQALYSVPDIEGYRTGSDPVLHPDVNWYEEVLREYAPASNYNLNFNGGNETVKYFVLLNATQWDGLYKKTGNLSEFSQNATYERYNFRTNVDIQLSNNLSATILLGGSVEDKTIPGIEENTGSQFGLMATVPPNSFPVYASHGMLGGNSLYANPLGEILQRGYVSSNGRTLQASFKLTEKLDMITPGLSISGASSFNTFFKTFSKKTKEYARYSASANELGEIILTQIGQNTSLEGNEDKSTQWKNIDVQAFINYNRIFGRNRLAAMLMSNYDAYSVTGKDLSFKNIGLAGRFTFSRSDKYIGEFSFGYNGTENFPKGSRFGFFPAGSLGWVVSNEEFLKDNSVFDYLKIRGSYGLTGNADIGGERFMFDQYYKNGTSYPFGTTNNNQTTVLELQLANPAVTWEKEKKFNIGVEMSLFNKFDVKVDFFNHNRDDILAQPYRDVPEYLGLTAPPLNVGEVNNKGFEASIRYNNRKSKNLQYFIEPNVWYAKNKIVYKSEKIQLFDYLYESGQPIDQPLLFEAIGFFKDRTDIDNSPRQIFTEVQPGDIKYKDQNGDNIIDQNDRYPVGNSKLPQLTLGLNSGLSYKGFDLDLFFQGVTNRSVYLDGKYFHAFQDDAKITSFALGRWTPETAATADYPRLSANNNQNNYQGSSFWQRDGSFIKLRSLEIGYTLPQRIVKKVKLSSTRVFLNGTNLFSLDHMEGFVDPEIRSGYPVLRSVSIGVNIQL